MAAMLRDSVVDVAVAVVRTRPRAIPVAMITMRKSIQEFPFLSYMSMGLCYQLRNSPWEQFRNVAMSLSV